MAAIARIASVSVLHIGPHLGCAVEDGIGKTFELESVEMRVGP